MTSVKPDKEQFLLEEYKNAAQLTFHIDELRNKLTSFFLIFNGLAASGLAILFKGEASAGFFEKPEVVICALLMLMSLIDLAAICILGRLRKVQIEHFRIINNIRQYFIKEDYVLWNVVQLSNRTMPKPNRISGTYFWLVIIMLVTSAMFGTSLHIFLTQVLKTVELTEGRMILLVVVLGGIFLEDKIYFAMAAPSAQLVYSKTHTPFESP